jgi:hypothetical protein
MPAHVQPYRGYRACMRVTLRVVWLRYRRAASLRACACICPYRKAKRSQTTRRVTRMQARKEKKRSQTNLRVTRMQARKEKKFSSRLVMSMCSRMSLGKEARENAPACECLRGSFGCVSLSSLLSSASVSICTFVPVKQVNGVPALFCVPAAL